MLPMITKVSYLAERPDFIPALAAGTLEQWSGLWPGRTLEWRIDRLRAHLNRRTLPIAWVIHDDSRVFGTAALRARDFEGLDHLTPWLGGVFVFPEFRGRGMGRTVCMTVESEAVRRGVTTLYLGTFDNRPWFESMGWRVFDQRTLRGRSCDVMQKPPQTSE
jgi:N-acetylglutamate synthase-like GNAT family acetyltransferase